MQYLLGKGMRRASVAALCGMSVLANSGAAWAQAADPRPQWMRDSYAAENRYLLIWERSAGADITKFDVWTNEGNPETTEDNLTIFEDPSPTVFNYVLPWGTRLLSSPHPSYAQANPDVSCYANHVTVRVDDPDSTTGFTDLDYPGDGAAVFAPPVVDLPRGQGFFAPYRFEDGTIEVDQKIEFARDLVRIEYTIRNVGTTSRRVGIRALVDPYVDQAFAFNANTRSMFIPDKQERVFFERDFGRATGTTTQPREARIPPVWEVYDKDEAPDPLFIAKGYLTGNGATTPTRVVFVNSLRVYPQTATWNLSVADPMELRISDKAVLHYWDPVQVPAGGVTSFVTYAGEGVANHVMSAAYLAGQARTARTKNYETQGYIGALQTPFALPLIGSNSDVGPTGNPLYTFAKAYMQNEYQDSTLPGASAFIDVPDGLQLPNGTSRLINMGRLGSLGSTVGNDEGSAAWQLQANGIEAGLLPVGITFSNAFQDSTRVTRIVNVPQGRRFQIGDDWRMFTFPFNYTGGDDDPVSVLGLPAGTFQVVEYNPLNGRYELATRLLPGHGYWVRMLGQGDTFIRAVNARAINLPLDDKYVARVERGWNQVGNPSPYSVPVRNLRILIEGGDRLTFEEAAGRGLIRPSLFIWDRKRNTYQQLNSDSQIPPGKGVWIFSMTEQNFLWPAPEGPELSITQ